MGGQEMLSSSGVKTTLLTAFVPLRLRDQTSTRCSPGTLCLRQLPDMSRREWSDPVVGVAQHLHAHSSLSPSDTFAITLLVTRV
ncbi:hypothetical protein EXN66_Car016295 [Channa argus]|uniref:Uncharacterized protein n=1 Tax=Channa argus TaxID=215402 RepID=A0A6G1QED8_CHAAH|nr:hypothetical protein EXN66_Car016295 [Channa argus]